MITKPKLLLLLLCCLILTNCKEDKKLSVPTQGTISKELIIAEFQADSAYNYIAKQLEFGFRVPGTKAHGEAKDWMVEKLKSFGGQVTVQEFKSSFMDVTNAASYNIISSYNPKAKKRISISAHWDSRKIAEKDPDPKKKNLPILGADDGGSGVGVIIEIARLLQAQPVGIGVDLILFDAEDQGNETGGWCLGAIYWGKNPHMANYKADFGVHLDMVGAKNAQFGQEGYSKQNAPMQVEKIWALAQSMGYNNYFQNIAKQPIEDDHVHMMKYRGYPIVNIINLSGNQEKVFGAHHHTEDDNLDIIDRNTLRAVGRVTTAVIYKFDHGSF
jgi:Zn-dependent M28 family amino/carboxypeptidase